MSFNSNSKGTLTSFETFAPLISLQQSENFLTLFCSVTDKEILKDDINQNEKLLQTVRFSFAMKAAFYKFEQYAVYLLMISKRSWEY